MSIRRVVPNVESDCFDDSRKFYAGFLGFDVAMDMGWVMTFASQTNPTAQITILAKSDTPAPHPQISIEVEDVNMIHAKAVEQGIPIVYPLTDEPWGVRRFFVVDPNGTVINILSHVK